MNRKFLIHELENTFWDMVIVGGGATGLGVALDAASRGLKVALIEKNDYASGPTSTSTKLIHGGVRYLEKAIKELDFGQFHLVKEALYERKIMLKNAPHISNSIPFVIPIYSFWQKGYYFFGTRFYDWIAGNDNIPNSKTLSKNLTLQKFPLLNPNIQSSVLYYDGQFNDAFYATALMRTASKYGACCLNYVQLNQVNFNQNSNTYHLTAYDRLNSCNLNIQSKLLVNCGGVQADSIRKMVLPDLECRLRPSKGIHIVLPREWLPTDHALLIPKTEDGRVIFIIPWYYATIIGTTDTEVHDFNQPPEVTEEDVEYLLKQVNPYLAQPIQKSDIIASFAGYRPLVKANKTKTEALIRNHEIETFENKKFISVLGGKWTTYRKMAEDAVNEAFKLLNLPFVACKTSSLPLIGANSQKFENTNHLLEVVHQHLHYYGSEYPILVDYLEKFGKQPLVNGYPFTLGECYFLKENCQIHTFDDLIYRGTRLGIINFSAAEKLKNIREIQDLFHY